MAEVEEVGHLFLGFTSFDIEHYWSQSLDVVFTQVVVIASFLLCFSFFVRAS